MPIFKYTVANKEGKKLNGTISVPDEESARKELNNLGFSILELAESTETIQEDKQSNKFVFEALDKHSKQITGTIPAKDEEETFRRLTKEYDLSVTAIWKEGATESEISKAKIDGTKKFQEKLIEEEELEKNTQKVKTLEEEKEEEFTKAKIETVLQNVNLLLQEFDQEFDKTQKAEINKKINKILRIKHSSNLSYILASAEELLMFLHDQEKMLKEKGMNDKQLELEIKTRRLLDNLKATSKPKTISDDIMNRIGSWEEKHSRDQGKFSQFLYNLLEKIKKFFETPPEILALREQVRAYNKQLYDFTLLYFKESSPDYKEKIKTSLKTVWAARKKAKMEISRVKKGIKERNRVVEISTGTSFISSLVTELNALTGWLLAFYIVYYFVAIYLTTKDFGLDQIPSSITVYESHTFKYILAIIFLLHSATSLKENFFKKSVIADIILIPTFVITSIIALLNF
ncbi:MAG: hypothetical protein WC285_00040 [Candidatus Gracilibacteria bacterium]|jgi:hypothetical protein